jgi:hypothetical protein
MLWCSTRAEGKKQLACQFLGALAEVLATF